MENVGGVHRKLPHLFSAERFLHQAGRPDPATEAGLERVVQGLHDRHADDAEPTYLFCREKPLRFVLIFFYLNLEQQK